MKSLLCLQSKQKNLKWIQIEVVGFSCARMQQSMYYFFIIHSTYMSVYIVDAKGQPQQGQRVCSELYAAQLALRSSAVSVFQL